MMKKTVEESVLYSSFVEQNKTDLVEMIEAINNLDINKVGAIAERNAFMMHATMLANKEPFLYLSSKSFEVIEFVRELRTLGYISYVTMDAGPNIKVITSSKDSVEIYNKLKEKFSYNLILSKPGEGSKIL